MHSFVITYLASVYMMWLASTANWCLGGGSELSADMTQTVILYGCIPGGTIPGRVSAAFPDVSR